MFLPILLFASFLGFVGFKLGKQKDFKVLTTKEPVVGYLPEPKPRYNHLAVLNKALRAGRQPPFALLQAAYAEAHQLQDVRLVEAVKNVARQYMPPAPQEQTQVPAEGPPEGLDDTGDEFDGNPESWGEFANPDQEGVPSAPRSTPSRACPLDGVDPACWMEFTEALRTRKPQWASDNHLGAYEHRRSRLKQLGIPETTLADEEGQYQALCADISDYAKSSLLQKWAGQAIDIDGVNHTITASGVLGLLKAAGPKGAEGWLNSSEDRKRFAGTTDVFVRCNGRF